jgi:ribosome-binding factor A
MRTIIAEAIQTRLSDPRIPLITSVTRVQVSEDLSVARVHVSVMASEAEREQCLKGLHSARGRIHGILREEMSLRKIPELVFRLDESVQGSFQTLQVIDRAMEELGVGPEWERDAADAPPDAERDERPAAGGCSAAPEDG